MRGAALALLTFSCFPAWCCGGGPGEQKPAGSLAARPAPPSADVFSEAAEAAGLRFIHFNGMTGDLTMPEILGPGVALFDYDNDGDLDVFIQQGGTLGASDATTATKGTGRTGQLFRNDL